MIPCCGSIRTCGPFHEQTNSSQSHRISAQLQMFVLWSIKPTLYTRIFRTNIVLAAFLQFNVRRESCQNDVRTKRWA